MTTCDLLVLCMSFMKVAGGGAFTIAEETICSKCTTLSRLQGKKCDKPCNCHVYAAGRGPDCVPIAHCTALCKSLRCLYFIKFVHQQEELDCLG